MNTSRNSTLLIPNKNLADRRLLRCFSAIVALLVLIGGFLPAIAEAQMQSSTSGNPQSIRLGEAIVVPGTAEALVPVYLTSEVEIATWQMGLEYDELLLNLVDVEFTGTESELLDPILIPTLNQNSNLSGFQVVYPGPDFFPTGEGLLAAFLRFQWIGTMPIPSPSGLSIPINLIDLETLPISMTSPSGLVTIPETQSADVVIHDYPLILVEESMAPLTAEDFLVPVRAWTSDSASTFMMGLEYDELLMTQFTVTGSDADRLSNGNWDLTIQTTPGGVICTLVTATPLPPLNGETLGFLRIDRPGNQPGQPGWGPWTIGLNPDNCEIDGTPVAYLEPGSMTWISWFMRGDANLDSNLDIADAETILGACYLGIPVDCEDAADTNDDGALDVSDVVSVLQFLFSGSPSPPAPYPDAGSDPTPDLLDCE
ncbi:MAG: dockerin type I repeat-containing protein [Planctomycetota bacterium]